MRQSAAPMHKNRRQDRRRYKHLVCAIRESSPESSRHCGCSSRPIPRAVLGHYLMGEERIGRMNPAEPRVGEHSPHPPGEISRSHPRPPAPYPPRSTSLPLPCTLRQRASMATVRRGPRHQTAVIASRRGPMDSSSRTISAIVCCASAWYASERESANELLLFNAQILWSRRAPGQSIVNILKAHQRPGQGRKRRRDRCLTPRGHYASDVPGRTQERSAASRSTR